VRSVGNLVAHHLKPFRHLLRDYGNAGLIQAVAPCDVREARGHVDGRPEETPEGLLQAHNLAHHVSDIHTYSFNSFYHSI
jgi:hypothetical protein